LSVRLLSGLVLLATILFSSPWTFRFWQAADYLPVVFLSVAAVCFTLLVRSPAIIERRLQTVERRGSQLAFIRAFRPLFFLIMFLPGLYHRFGLTRTIFGEVSPALTLVCDGLIVAATLFVGWVLCVNECAGRNIRVEENQRVIDTGPYGLVGHPLNSGSLLMFDKRGTSVDAGTQGVCGLLQVDAVPAD
jgi:protein-S-isoprenylcysteine O-methyltransferase Ste14